MKRSRRSRAYPDEPALDIQPRVYNDVARLLDFIARQPWGDPVARERDIEAAINAVLAGPEFNAIRVRRRKENLALRRYNTSQFAVIYAYDPPGSDLPHGLVSIRAIRHNLTKNVFWGVREQAPAYGLSDKTFSPET